MLDRLNNLEAHLIEDPSRAQALVDSGVFGWDTEMVSVEPMRSSQRAYTLFHTVARSPRLDADMLSTIHAWFLDQPDGRRRWRSLLWGVAYDAPVIRAFELGLWEPARVLSDAMRHDAPATLDYNDPLAPGAWLVRWNFCFGRYKHEQWATATTWLVRNGWVHNDAWTVPFNPGWSDGEHHPLSVTAERQGPQGVDLLLKLGARPRGMVRLPGSVSTAPDRPFLYQMLERWFLHPSIKLQNQRADLETSFTRMVAADMDALADQVVPFGSPKEWPAGLELAANLTAEERATVLTRRAQVPLKGRGAAPASSRTSTGPGLSADLPLDLLLRALGPAPVQVLLERRMLQEDLGDGAAPSAVTAPRHRL